WEMMARAPLIAHMLDGVGRDDAMPTPVQNEVVRVSRAMFLQSQSGGGSLFQVLPEPGREGSWLSPAEVVAQASQLQTLNTEISALAKMAEAYRAGDAAAFDEAGDTFNAAVAARAPAEIGNTSLGLEVFKN